MLPVLLFVSVCNLGMSFYSMDKSIDFWGKKPKQQKKTQDN